MPIDPNNLTDYALFKYLWTHPDTGLAHRGLDEVTPEGAERLAKYALEHNLDGTASAANAQKIDADEKALMKAILEHEHYGSFFELDGRPVVFNRFGIDPGNVHVPIVNHPAQEPKVDIPSDVSSVSAAQLRQIPVENLAKVMAQEYAQRKSFFEAQSVPAEQRALRTLGLLKSYAGALWSHAELENTESAGHALLDAYDKLPFARNLGAKDMNGAGWSAAQSLVLGLDPTNFIRKFPEARPTADTTYLSMSDDMAESMRYVDKYRAALGQPKKAEELELKSPLGFILGEESGHYKRGNLDEKQPFTSSGLNWGKLLFPGDEQIAKLPPKKDFDFPIDCLDALENFVVVRPGDRLKVVGPNNSAVKVEKLIQKKDGKPVSWSAKFTNAAGGEIAPDKVLGLITTGSGSVKGDGKAESTVDMWWWGFCDRNTAQRLYKSRFQIPQLDRETIKIKAGTKTISIPKEHAQKIIDSDIPDIVTGETFSGFRFNDEPQHVALKNGDVLTGRVKGLALEAGPGARRLAGDMLAIHDAPGRPMLGTISITEEGDQEPTVLEAKKIDKMTLDPATNKVTVKMKEGWPEEVTGKLETKVPWNKAKTVGGKKVLTQKKDMPIRGEFVVQLAEGGTRKVDASDVNQIVGEAQKDMRLSQYVTWVSQNGGMYATDSSTGPVVSNGMRWVNKIDVEVQKDDQRPSWAPTAELNGIEGPLDRQPGDRILWVRGLYAYDAESEPNSQNFAGWVQVGKHGRILNEGFTTGAPDFAWGANGKLNWLAPSSFNPYVDPKLRLALLVNGVKDAAKLEAMAEKLNLPSNWKSYRVPQGNG